MVNSKQYLSSHGFSFNSNTDIRKTKEGYNVIGNIAYSGGLKELPVKFNIIDGGFSLTNYLFKNYLTSTYGFPKKVNNLFLKEGFKGDLDLSDIKTSSINCQKNLTNFVFPNEFCLDFYLQKNKFKKISPSKNYQIRWIGLEGCFEIEYLDFSECNINAIEITLTPKIQNLLQLIFPKLVYFDRNFQSVETTNYSVFLEKQYASLKERIINFQTLLFENGREDQAKF